MLLLKYELNTRNRSIVPNLISNLGFDFVSGQRETRQKVEVEHDIKSCGRDRMKWEKAAGWGVF